MFFGSFVQPKSEGLGVTVAVLFNTPKTISNGRLCEWTCFPGGAGVVVSISSGLMASLSLKRWASSVKKVG